MKHLAFIASAIAIGVAAACGGDEPPSATTSPAAPVSQFDADVAFLKQHTEVILLSDAEGSARVAVAPEYQGRVMTSTTGGEHALSFGWLGRAAIASRQKQPHINVFGGEDRFWLGPEGGQYSLFFKPGEAFDLAHWQVPDAIDWGGWDVVGEAANSVAFKKRMAIVNYSGTQLDIDVDRAIRLLSLVVCSPRTRGDEPMRSAPEPGRGMCSPRTRG